VNTCVSFNDIVIGMAFSSPVSGRRQTRDRSTLLRHELMSVQNRVCAIVVFLGILASSSLESRRCCCSMSLPDIAPRTEEME